MPIQSGDWLSRAEFEQFERSVSNGFEDVRRAITSLSTKLDGQVGKGTNWSAVSVILSAMVALGSVFAFAIFNKIDGSNELSSERNLQNNQRIERLERLDDRLRSVEITVAKKE